MNKTRVAPGANAAVRAGAEGLHEGRGGAQRLRGHGLVLAKVVGRGCGWITLVADHGGKRGG